jgi:condensin-2 complex subunit H2
MASQDGDEGSRAKFSHLLQPIRDLALNWDINIASALEEYLDDIEGITISLGDELRHALTNDAESINFAEAALLIQGSALIYSKKVEYLYQLVHHTLEVLSSQKASTKALVKQSKDAVDEDEQEFKDAGSFLLLEDFIKEVFFWIIAYCSVVFVRRLAQS